MRYLKAYESFIPNENKNTPYWDSKWEELLPKEIKKDWFEVTPEPIRVKDRHLINTTRPVGINTIGTTLKNPSLDIRGAPSCPKYVVSPWMQSSIEPDTNIKPFCGM
jgi:hypothetical protein